MANPAKPNILFIMADDIGWFNVSCYNHGIMGYRTPNIDRIAKEGAMFTDFYGSRAVRPGAPPLLPASRRFVLDLPKSARRARRSA